MIKFNFLNKLLRVNISSRYDIRRYNNKLDIVKKFKLKSIGTKQAQNSFKNLYHRLFPDLLQRKNLTKLPRALYIANDATQIANAIKPFHKKDVPFFEVNPGPGILTKLLLTFDCKDLLLFENDSHFIEQLQNLVGLHKNVSLENQNLMSAWNDVVIDKFTQPLQSVRWDEEINSQTFICLPSTSFINTLANAVIFQNNIFAKGRMEFFMILPAAEYIKLTCGPDATYDTYTAKSCTFQILFEYEFLQKVSRFNFLPLWAPRNLYKCKKSRVVETFENDFFYLIRVVPRRNLLTLCKPDDLLALAYFIIQIFWRRKSYIIQKLERWIPGCGINLICKNNPPKSNKLLDSSVNLEILPPYSMPCADIITDDYIPPINTFTKSGELTPSQVFALFNYFKNLPGYAKYGFTEQVEIFFEAAAKREEQKKIIKKIDKV